MNGEQDAVRRSLSPTEVGTLAKLVEAAPAEFGPLREQIAAAVVTGRCQCGCATVDIAVDQSRAAPVPSAYSGVLPVEGALRLPDRQYVAGVLVFLADGWLAGLEVYNFDDEPVDEFPGPERLDVASADTDPD
jgi:hypothetical protein